MSREAKVENELYRLLKNVLEKRGYTAEGVRFDGVEPQYRVDNRRADLALVLVEKKPLLIIETKRKFEIRGYYREERKIDPTSRVVIDQALWYSIHCGSPFLPQLMEEHLRCLLCQRGERGFLMRSIES